MTPNYTQAGFSTTPVPEGNSKGNDNDVDYKRWLGSIENSFLQNYAEAPLFTTNYGSQLFDIYLDNFPKDRRQYHNCKMCRQFIENYGSLVTVDERGNMVPVMWDVQRAPSDYRRSVSAMVDVLKGYGHWTGAEFSVEHNCKITGVFVSSDRVWGVKRTGTDHNWYHFSVLPPANHIYKSDRLSAKQMAALYVEDYQLIRKCLDKYRVIDKYRDTGKTVIETAVSLLESGALKHVSGIEEPLLWLHDLCNRLAYARADKQSNLIWLAVSKKLPFRYSHVGTLGPTGALLKDILMGHTTEQVIANCINRLGSHYPAVHTGPRIPTRPGVATASLQDTPESTPEKVVVTAPPSSDIPDALHGLERSLKRRMASIEDIQTIWVPSKPKPRESIQDLKDRPTSNYRGSIFSHLYDPSRDDVVHVDRPYTWAKFEREVMPGAEKIYFYAPDTIGSYGSIVTAVHYDAPPILQWDTPDNRNPCNWYQWVRGSLPNQYSLQGNAFHEVIGISHLPHMWNGGSYDRHRKGVLLIVQGAKDTRKLGLALFPEVLKSSLRGVSNVISTYSTRSGKVLPPAPFDLPEASGYLLEEDTRWHYDVSLRVHRRGRISTYRVDRWD